MVTLTTRRHSASTLDPRLFTFKPKLNEKSNQIAQNLLSGFYERQFKHAQRLQDIRKEAGFDHRQWYCHIRPPAVPQPLPNINLNYKSKSENQPTKVEAQSSDENDVNENLSSSSGENDVSEKLLSSGKNDLNEELLSSGKNDLNEKLLSSDENDVNEKLLLSKENKARYRSVSPRKEAQQSNAHLSRLTRAYLPPVKSKTTQPTASTLPPASASTPTSVPVPVKHTHRMLPSNRTKSPPKVVRQADSSPKRITTNDTINIERLKLARDEAERAMKEHKIFTIIGPYPALREALRRRGWIEKFYRGTSLPAVHGNKRSDKKNSRSDDDDDDDNDDDNDDDDLDDHSDEDEDKIPPWEENDGYYGLLSRLVRTAAPNFIWSVRATYDTSTLNKDQMVNHYSRNGCFTTKVGLCNSLRNLQWFHSGCADQFFPRCYKLSHEDDRVAFIDDYRLTACISFLKLIQNRCKGVIEPDMNSILAMSSDNPSDPKNPIITNEEELPPLPPPPPQLTRSLTMPPGQLLSKSLNGKISSTKKVPLSFIEFALNKVTDYTLARDHEDIDINLNTQTDSSDEQWTQFIEQFYAASHSNAEIEGMELYLNKIDQCLKNVEYHWPQYHIDGTRNIWILKPGAKSRGRGIVVYDRLEDILKLCSSTLTKDGKFVVQKYIERPLLIHNTKFDIRQWFLVTDWNPLTIWMFKDCYLRFCTEHFSLETRQQNVHLCNHSIQKHYKNNSNRHIDLPVENMWTNREFIEKYLRPMNLAGRWDKFIYPAMKDAIICSMLVAQDTIDQRKNSFELFGADFMLGEDLKPWLIEINCSPTMAPSTAVTTEMCDDVLEDTCKVMIDRKYNRTADTGRFELIHRGTCVPIPIYVGIDLRVEGKTLKTVRPANNVSTPTVVPQNNTNNNHNNNHNNNNNNPMNTSVSALLQTNTSSSSSSSSNSPAETRPSASHPTSALGTTQHQSFTPKPPSHPVTLKLRREVTQPILSRVELVSTLDSPLEKIAANDNFPIQYRSNITNHKSKPKNIRINPSRLSADYFPVRQISRSRVNDRPPSPKDVKVPKQFAYFRPYSKTWFTYKTKESSATTITNFKRIRSQKTSDGSSTLLTITTLSNPATIETISNLDTDNGHTMSSSSILSVT